MRRTTPNRRLPTPRQNRRKVAALEIGRWKLGADREGYTFVELIIVVTILLILASAVLPLAQVTSQRQREAELRRDLREIRTALDKFKDAVDVGQIPPTELRPENEGYPPDLDTLVEGVSAA